MKININNININQILKKIKKYKENYNSKDEIDLSKFIALKAIYSKVNTYI